MSLDTGEKIKYINFRPEQLTKVIFYKGHFKFKVHIRRHTVDKQYNVYLYTVDYQMPLNSFTFKKCFQCVIL